VRLPLLPLPVSVAEWRGASLPRIHTRVRPPPDTLGDRLTVGPLALNQVMFVRVELPELKNSSSPRGATRGLGEGCPGGESRTSYHPAKVEFLVQFQAGVLGRQRPDISSGCAGSTRASEARRPGSTPGGDTENAKPRAAWIGRRSSTGRAALS